MSRNVRHAPVFEPPVVVENLATRRHWDEVHACESAELSHWGGSEPPRRSRLGRLLRPLVDDGLRRRLANYDDHILWNVLYESHLPRRKGARVLEVGSAPGDHLVRLHRRFGLEPYGIERSAVGAALNRDVFRRAGIPTSHVIEADVFSEEIALSWDQTFDVVLSRGFVEHYRDARPAVERHVQLLAPGGTLVVVIPNLRGVNRALSWFFNPPVLAMHNLEIMTRASFAKLFEGLGLATLFCDYFGIFNVRVHTARAASWRETVLDACASAQPLLNLAFHGLFGDRGAESRFFSPSIAYIGVKGGSSAAATVHHRRRVASSLGQHGGP
jgi:SAM-dependent methyltransferase